MNFNIFSIVLLVTLLTTVNTFAMTGETCEAAFASPTSTDEIRASVMEKLGFLPEIKRTKLADLSDVKLFAPGVEQIKANAIAYSSYRNLNGTTLEVEMTWVREDLRQFGLSKLLFAEILAEHPQIERIHVSDLVDTNLEIFETARKTLGKKKSIRKTPLYRKYAAFGFTEIKKVKIVKLKSHSLRLGGRDYEMVTRHPSIQFDLIRPKQN